MIGRILEGEIRLVGVGLAGAVERLRRMELEAQEGVDGYGSSERERGRRCGCICLTRRSWSPVKTINASQTCLDSKGAGVVRRTWTLLGGGGSHSCIVPRSTSSCGMAVCGVRMVGYCFMLHRSLLRRQVTVPKFQGSEPCETRIVLLCCNGSM